MLNSNRKIAKFDNPSSKLYGTNIDLMFGYFKNNLFQKYLWRISYPNDIRNL